MQLQFEDGVDLDVAKPDSFRGADVFGGDSVFLAVELHAAHRARGNFYGLVLEELVQILAGVGAARRSADDLNHVVDVVERDAVAEQDVLALARLAQLVLRATADHVGAMLDEELQQLDQAQLARLPGHDREQDHAERFLHLRVLEQVREDDFRLFVALHFDHDAHAVAVAFVANVGDAFDLFVLDQLGDVLDEAGLVHLIGKLGDDDVLAIFTALFDRSLCAHLEAAAAGLISLFDSFAAVDITAGGKIGAGDEL